LANEASSVEWAEGKAYTVEPELAKKDVILLLKRSAIAAEFLPEIKNKYGCKGTQCKNLAYLPLIIRPAWDEQAEYYNRKYRFGLVACLDHHAFWPARESDVEDFKRGRLPFLWLELLREDLAGDNGRGKNFPKPEELTEAVSVMRKQRKISAKVAREIGWALGIKDKQL